MGMKDWWKRLLARFSKEEAREDAPVIELVPAEAPEPAPKQKTSDELIAQMADAQADAGYSETQKDAVPEEPQGLRAAPEEDFEEGADDELFTEEAIGQAVFDEDFSEGEWDDFG